jgi:excisionase family DNA binding protein
MTATATAPASDVRLRVREAARRFGVAPSTVRRWIEHGVLRGYRPAGGRGYIYVLASDVEALLRQPA